MTVHLPARSLDVCGIASIELWIGDTCAVAALHLAAAREAAELKAAIADLLRRIADGCVRLDRPVPVIGLLCGAIPTDFPSWMSDQDWHRGDFLLRCCPDGPEAEVEQALAGIAAWKGGKTKLARIAGAHAYAETIERRLAARRASAERGQLLRAVIGDLRRDDGQWTCLLEWENAALERAEGAAMSEGSRSDTDKGGHE